MGTCSCGQTRNSNNDIVVNINDDSNEVGKNVVEELNLFKELLDSGESTARSASVCSQAKFA